MHYSKLVHWAEGQFLQPHHFQQLQRSVFEAMDKDFSLAMPYKEGVCSLELNLDALSAKRIAINEFSAIIPDGTRLSMPGNTCISPITLDLDLVANGSQITVYLALPNYQKDEANVIDDTKSNRRYELVEQSFLDENTGDNDASVIMRKYHASLVIDPALVPDCAVLPIAKFDVISTDNNKSVELNLSYIPPCVVLERKNGLFTKVSEFCYELKSSRNKIVADLETEGLADNLFSGGMVLKLMQLQLLNKYLTSLQAYLIPNRVTPFILYLELAQLLAELQALYAHSKIKDVVAYDHYNLWHVFSELINSIRTLISTSGKASCLEFDFIPHMQLDCLSVTLDDKTLVSGTDYYLALSSDALNLKDFIADIEEGDKFRLLDKGSKGNRIRGIKLVYVRFPPSYIPTVGSNTVVFKVMKDESSRMWRYVLEDHELVIDYAQSLFTEFKAKLLVAVVNEG